MKRWVLIAILLCTVVIAWTVPRGTPPAGCMTAFLYPDTAYVYAYSCDGLSADTIRWTAPSQHRRCVTRFIFDFEYRRMEVARANCEAVRHVDFGERRVA